MANYATIHFAQVLGYFPLSLLCHIRNSKDVAMAGSNVYKTDC